MMLWKKNIRTLLCIQKSWDWRTDLNDAMEKPFFRNFIPILGVVERDRGATQRRFRTGRQGLRDTLRQTAKKLAKVNVRVFPETNKTQQKHNLQLKTSQSDVKNYIDENRNTGLPYIAVSMFPSVRFKSHFHSIRSHCPMMLAEV